MNDLHDSLASEIPDLPAGPWPLLGEGVWGTVHDLGDGTVLKLVRQNGGLGTGASKHFREASALRLLGNMTGLRLPQLVDAGRFENAYGFSGPPLAGWLRLEKLAGRPADEGGLYALKTQERERLGEEIGAALADFHDRGRALAGDAGKLGNPNLRSIDEAMARISAPEQRARLERLKEMIAAEEGERVLLHGDLNFSNILVARGERPGFIDFAEAGTGLPEEDFRHFENPGPLRDAIFRTYAAISGRAIDMQRVRMAIAVNAACTLAIGSNAGHPREGMRRVSFLDEALRAAGIEA
ncbi:aminoglycoside phosphotransferase family protein [Parvibaculum sp.]|jgi:aminoglycoside phosphotransferase (APT) family kinase protein|uniref:phosphotransferase family protein n=1 Tax=Parvibaculum sp. TaxID=2024848 RepID=UPI001B03971E|nr:aminoglycoside phosphotransferase family protein [Parvibaculum sp.]MBO6633769.1 aminoglycoside phosphotransferase family protein [Parvibaculum sp.]MBO6677618.1 aminoglycoside phosphotransferase family protein [Parvibaculum sp.]MBO6684324.1 aminoglycoside phosphotransferase family protein [Parvibaculum sp.]